jgi:hypothetical protein
MNKMLVLALFPVALGANATCVTDQPEMGDIGPASGLVCQELTQRFPGATLAVEGRSIHSPTEVRVTASVDGRPVMLDYRLAGVIWSVVKAGSPSADKESPRSDRPTPNVASTASKGAGDVSEIERRRLFEPTPGELRAEAAGRIYIYEGLRDTDVERALEEEFKRVESMMFIRVKPTDEGGHPRKDSETGAEYFQNDGC